MKDYAWVSPNKFPKYSQERHECILWHRGDRMKHYPGRGRKKQKRNPEHVRRRSEMTNSLRYLVMRRDGFVCVLCGNTGRDAKLVVDHIVPVAAGGGTDMENLRTLCHPCNSGKSDKTE